MYRYDEFDHTLVRERVAQFRDQLIRHRRGEIDDEEFRQLRLRNGLYHQRFAYMLRVAVPYGQLNAKQLRKLAYVARTYDKGYGHFTTRTNIQFNWPELDDVPDILEQLAEVEMHAIQTSGNVIRNTTTDALAGVAADEIEDPRPWCEIIRQWSTLHPEFNWLPRKFKVAITGAEEDRASTLVHDIGLRIIKNDQGEVGFKVFVGGGLGRSPFIGKPLRDFLPWPHLLSYLESILRVYNQEGRRDNLYKARIKILVDAMGIDAFAEKVEALWETRKDQGLALDQAMVDTFKSYFVKPDYAAKRASLEDRHEFAQKAASNPLFKQWLDNNTQAHREEGFRIVNISLKASDVAAGDITADQMEVVADLAETYGFDEVRSSYDQNLLLPSVAEEQLYDVWRVLSKNKLATPNIGTVRDMICCPGLDYCNLSHAHSIAVWHSINDRLDRLDYVHDLGEVKIKISGCHNACAHHHIGDIGLLGLEKKGNEWFQITLAGYSANEAHLGLRLGRAVSKDDIPDVVEKILETYLEQRNEEELFRDTVHRVGVAPFKEKVYATH